jgi:hypothetical protein
MRKTLLLLLLAASCFGQRAISINHGGNPALPYPRVVATVALTDQTAEIPTTTLFTPQSDGLYRISSYGVVTAPNSGPNGLWEVQLNWTDDSGPQGCAALPYGNGGSSPSPCSLMVLDSGGIPGLNNYGQSWNSGYYSPPNNTAVVQAKAGAPIAYAVGAAPAPFSSPTGSTYELFITVEQLMEF